MAFHPGAELGDVFRFGIVHLEEAPDFEPEGDGVERPFGAGLLELFDVDAHGIHRLSVFGIQSRLHERRRHVVAVDRAEVLLDLLTAPVPVHVAPAADVHQDVEGEGVAAAEFLDEFVIGTPRFHTHVYDVLLLLLSPVAHDREDLRCFRLSRIEGRITFKTRAEHDFPPPSEVDLSRYRDRAPWQLADAMQTAAIDLSPTIAWWVDQMFGTFGEMEERADGSAVFRTDYGGERELQRFIDHNAHRVAYDAVDAPCVLLEYAGELRAMQDNWPKIRFHALREHAGLVFQKQLEG